MAKAVSTGLYVWMDLPEPRHCHYNTYQMQVTFYIKRLGRKCEGLDIRGKFTKLNNHALIPYHGHLLMLLNHVVIVVKLCCVEGLMEDRFTFNKHSR